MPALQPPISQLPGLFLQENLQVTFSRGATYRSLLVDSAQCRTHNTVTALITNVANLHRTWLAINAQKQDDTLAFARNSMLTESIYTFAAKRFIHWCLAVIILFALAAPALRGAPQAKPANVNDAEQQLWAAIITPNLKRVVTSNDQAQTVGVTWMVPMHAAFHRKNEAWMHEFADHFARYASDPSTLPTGEVAELSRLYYLYLASQFLVLAKGSGQENLIPPNLSDLIFTEVRTYWNVTPAWQFDSPHFNGGARERLLWKLKHKKVKKSYYRAVLDHDLYVFGIVGDLKAFESPAQQRAWDPLLNDVLAIAHQVFTQEVAPQPNGGWVFQPGVWTDHPEYAYAGDPEAHPGIKAKPVPGIAPDTSHSLRFPLWLSSLMSAYPQGSPEHQFYENLRSGLDKQFFDKVLHQPTADFPCFAVTNFMDGSNGVYRWSYNTLGTGNGYGPYQNSASFVLGWWIFLDTDRIRKAYRELAAQFPWPKPCDELYLGPHPAAVPRPESAYDPKTSSVLRTLYLTSLLAASL